MIILDPILYVQTSPQLGVGLTTQPMAAGLDGAVLTPVLTVRTGLAGVAAAAVAAHLAPLASWL